MARIRNYETMFIMKPTLSKEETVVQIELVKNIITANGGEIVECNDMGSRELAYEIQKNKRGYYYVIYFTSPTESILEIERNYNINETILRHMFIKFESKKEITAWTSMKDAAAKKTAKEA